MAQRETVFQGGVVRRERRLPIRGEVFVQEGGRVQPDTLIARTEVIPGDPYVVNLKREFGVKNLGQEDFERALQVKMGDRVDRGQPLARARRGFWAEAVEVRSPVEGVVEFTSAALGQILIREEARSANPVMVVNVARELDVWPALVRAYTRYREGDFVERGAVLATAPGGSSMAYCYAPAAGTVERIDSHTGTIYLVRPTRVTELDAYIAGTVEKVIEDLGAVIVSQALELHGVFGVGGERYGELMVAADTPDTVLDEAGVPPEAAGYTLVAGAGVTAAALARAGQVGVAGIIAGAMDHQDLMTYAGEDLGVVTGHEQVPFPVILTEGFGTLAMNRVTFDLLRRLAGRTVSICGATQVRAGALRPEVIISLEGEGLEPPGSLVRSGDLEVGARVRVIRRPHFGRWGTVTDLPPGTETLETGSRLPVARVRLDDGGEVTVARANLEVYELEVHEQG